MSGFSSHDQQHLFPGELTGDERHVLEIMSGWVPSGIGSIRFGDISYQARWPFKRASKAVCGLESKGVIVSIFVKDFIPSVRKEIDENRESGEG